MTQCIGPHLVRASNLANVGHVKKTGGRLETRAWLRGSLQSLEQDERLLHPLTHFIHFIQYAIHWVPNMLSCFSPPAPPPPGPWVCVDAFSWSTSRPPLLLPHTLAVPTLLASWYSTIQLHHTLPPCSRLLRASITTPFVESRHRGQYCQYCPDTANVFLISNQAQSSNSNKIILAITTGKLVWCPVCVWPTSTYYNLVCITRWWASNTLANYFIKY